MADIFEVIRNQYNIDIRKVNIFKLYKIDSVDISEEELEIKFSECRKRWQQSVNGANEKFAERDRKHLEHAADYEKILKNKKQRKALFEYYNKGNGNNESLNFARVYFKLIANTTKIQKEEVEFFLNISRNSGRTKGQYARCLNLNIK